MQYSDEQEQMSRAIASVVEQIAREEGVDASEIRASLCEAIAQADRMGGDVRRADGALLSPEELILSLATTIIQNMEPDNTD